ncbi:MAG TPA: ester cyclase [Candidatus Binatus sp.]|nr:ester cyclase [Candidatus Binatus sp.]
MQIHALLLADSAQAVDGKLYVLGGAWNMLRFPEFQIEDVIAEDDRVAVRLITSAIHSGTFMGIPPSGRRYTISEIHIFRITDGQVAEHWHEFDRAALFRQLRGETG